MGIVLLVVIYLLPTIIAVYRQTSVAAVIINIFLGWTLLGWVFALILALQNKTRQVVI